NILHLQSSCTGFPIIWIDRKFLLKIGHFLSHLPKPYIMLFDLHGVDERFRMFREHLPKADFSVFYHLISI
ncbi:MAG: NADH-quinone oxidoreductase subunit C/D, partial [Candidatus Regiella insecticola]|nr:NADH-quinone oxidoreductase subunit C/D [Candidatus Regiella insecticola]